MPSTAHRLIDAFLSGDAPSAAALLAPDAKFHSPIRELPPDESAQPPGDRHGHGCPSVPATRRTERLGGRSSPTRRTTCDRIGDDAGATNVTGSVLGNESAATGRRRAR
jgi:hypothetical protein